MDRSSQPRPSSFFAAVDRASQFPLSCCRSRLPVAFGLLFVVVDRASKLPPSPLFAATFLLSLTLPLVDRASQPYLCFLLAFCSCIGLLRLLALFLLQLTSRLSALTTVTLLSLAIVARASLSRLCCSNNSLPLDLVHRPAPLFLLLLYQPTSKLLARAFSQIQILFLPRQIFARLFVFVFSFLDLLVAPLQNDLAACSMLSRSRLFHL